MTYRNILAFSLIELSIVLIIIGLLIAGVTGGASLIESAKKRALLNEINSYKQAFLAFYVKNGRYPGDKNNIGFVGYNSGQIYNANSFPFPYNGTDTANNHFQAGILSAPFIDMYLDKILEFEPKGMDKNSNPSTLTLDTTILPFSKVYKDLFYHYEKAYDNNINNSNFTKYNFRDIQILLLRYAIDAKKNHKMAYIMKDIDTKLDDGLYNSGNVRSACQGPYGNFLNSYDDAINSKSSCHIIYLKVL